MKLKLLAVGTRMPDWVEAGCQEYGKRMPPELRIQTIDVPLGARGKNQPTEKAIESESQGLLKAIGERDFVVALDVLGKPMNRVIAFDAGVLAGLQEIGFHHRG